MSVLNLRDQKKPRGQEIKQISVTPEMAREWLEWSVGANFRRLDKERGERMAASIAAAGWVLDANPIKFNSDGKLVDGQHRLYAIQRLGLTVLAWIATGVDDQSTVDTGVSRSLTKILENQKEIYPDRLASTLAYVHAHMRGKLSMSHRHRGSNRELLELLENEPDIRNVVNVIGSLGHGIPSGHVGLVCFLARKAGKEEEANAFVKALKTGVDLSENDPALLLRERMIKNKASKAKMQTPTKLALVIKAWNAWNAGRELGCLKWSSVGPTKEPFPRVITDAKEYEEWLEQTR